LDDFQIEEIPLDGAAQKNTNRAKGTAHSMEGNPIVAKSGDWPLEVGVHRTCWNNNAGLGKANWIASGTASGLCRIDIIQGRFIGGKVPQGMGPP
jgi:transcription factor C subunit 6